MNFKKTDCFIIGTRPEIIKCAPLILKMKPFVIHTGQHSELAQQSFNVFEIDPDIDLKLMKINQNLNTFIADCIKALTIEVKKHEFKRIWVQGDTATALAGARVAHVLNIELCHLEAGLRTFDKKEPYPEEKYRIEIDKLSTHLFAPTYIEATNLEETIKHGHIYTVGNTIVDAINLMKKSIPDSRPIALNYILATIHRRESFGKTLYEIFGALKELSNQIHIVLPAHPNPNVRKVLDELDLEYEEPFDYLTFLMYLQYCDLVVTDSGGVQEEAPSFEKKVVVLRHVTERTSSVSAGYSILPKKLEKNEIIKTIKQFLKEKVCFSSNPFGDGLTSDRIINIIKKYEKIKQ